MQNIATKSKKVGKNCPADGAFQYGQKILCLLCELCSVSSGDTEPETAGELARMAQESLAAGPRRTSWGALTSP